MKKLIVTETSDRMIDAQIAVQKKSSMSRWLVSASVISRTIALTNDQDQPQRDHDQREREEAQDGSDDDVHGAEQERPPTGTRRSRRSRSCRATASS
jgi:hypothetical protein